MREEGGSIIPALEPESSIAGQGPVFKLLGGSLGGGGGGGLQNFVTTGRCMTYRSKFAEPACHSRPRTLCDLNFEAAVIDINSKHGTAQVNP